tara:strand:- start:320 stop:835 length:516 start_codon:yes stop_codon:yes gene_type:complete
MTNIDELWKIYEYTLNKKSNSVCDTEINLIPYQDFFQMLNIIINELNNSIWKEKPCFFNLGKDENGKQMGFIGTLQGFTIIDEKGNMSNTDEIVSYYANELLYKCGHQKIKEFKKFIIIVIEISNHYVPISITNKNVKVFEISTLNGSKTINYNKFNSQECWRNIPIEMSE